MQQASNCGLHLNFNSLITWLSYCRMHRASDLFFSDCLVFWKHPHDFSFASHKQATGCGAIWQLAFATSHIENSKWIADKRQAHEQTTKPRVWLAFVNSHTVFSLRITGRRQAHGQTTTLHGSLHLVDLAGSERLAKSNATGERLKEVCVEIFHDCMCQCEALLSGRLRHKGLVEYSKRKTEGGVCWWHSCLCVDVSTSAAWVSQSK